jgi:hypothetical protein
MTNKEKEVYLILHGWKKKDDWYYLDIPESEYNFIGPFTLLQAYRKSIKGINSVPEHVNERNDYYRRNRSKVCNWQINHISDYFIDKL